MIKTLIFDVDGVLLNFEAGYKNYLAQQKNRNLTKDLDYYTDPEWDFLNSEEFAKLPTLIDPEKFNKLCAGYNVWLITNLPYRIRNTRLKNLTNAGFAFDKLILAGLTNYDLPDYLTKAEVMLQNFDPQEKLLFVDDYDENCIEVASKFSNAKIFLLEGLHPIVKSHPNCKIVPDWKNLEKEIISLLH